MLLVLTFVGSCVRVYFGINTVMLQWAGFSACDHVSLFIRCLNIFFSRCDSPEKLKALLPRLEQELKDTGKFKDFYQFTFNFAKNPGQKGLGKQE